MEKFKEKKALQSLIYFANKLGGTLNKMKALKLIWLSDRYHLRHYGRTITGDQYFAMNYGPVASCTRDILENGYIRSEEGAFINISKYINNEIDVDGYFYQALTEPILDVFSETDIEALAIIFEQYKDYNQFTLSELSHKFPEWMRYEANFIKSKKGRYVIQMDDFFKNVNEKKGLFVDDETFLQESKEIYLEYSA